MRGDPDRPRGEAARVAARVQALLREYHLDSGAAASSSVETSAGSSAAPSDPLPWLDAVLVPAEPLRLRTPGAAPLAEVGDLPLLRVPGAAPLVDVGDPLLRAPGAARPAEVGGGGSVGSPEPEWQVRPAGRRGSPSRDGAFAFAPREQLDPVESSADLAAEPPEPGLWQRVIGRVPVRLDPGRRTAVAMGAAVLLAAVVTGLWLLTNRPRTVPVAATSHPPSVTASPSASLSATASPAVLVVDVAGKVHRPGLYRLPAGSRVDDAIRAAGGAKAGVDLSGLNLAAKLVDGQQIAVGTAGAPGGPAGTAGGSAAPAGPVNLNSASIEQLETLPGVGPVLAQHILDYRTQHGGFTSIDQLREVSGIGDVRFTQLKALVTA